MPPTDTTDPETLTRVAELAAVAARQLRLAERLELDARAELLDTVRAMLDALAGGRGPGSELGGLLAREAPGGGRAFLATCALVRDVVHVHRTLAREAERELRTRSLAAAAAPMRR